MIANDRKNEKSLFLRFSLLSLLAAAVNIEHKGKQLTLRERLDYQ